MNSLERFMAACNRTPVDRPPVWLMRQAGRYLPEYRLLRARHPFIELCKTPKIACEASLQPWQRFKMDAVIVVSDILFIPEAMGLSLTFKENEGPRFSPAIKSVGAVAKLQDVNTEMAFSFVYDTIKLLKKKLPPDVPVIGFSGGPWTLAYYMADKKIGELAEKIPDGVQLLLSKLSDIIGDYLRLQQEAGANVIQIFDTWAGDLTARQFREIELPNLKKIVRKIDVPVMVYSRKCRHILQELVETGADVVSIDCDTPMEEAIAKIGDAVAIQGNIDPKTLLTSPGAVKEAVSRLLSKIKGRNGHIINLGHGVLPTTQLECVEAFIETVKHG